MMLTEGGFRNHRHYTPHEFQQMNMAVIDAMLAHCDKDGGFEDFEIILERAVHNITEQRMQGGEIVMPYGGYPLRRKMEELGPRERMKLQVHNVFNYARSRIRQALRGVLLEGEKLSETKAEETQRFWAAASRIRELYMLPVRWRRIAPGARNAAFLEAVTMRELRAIVAVQQDMKDYGEEGIQLFGWMVETMAKQGAEEDTTVAEVFGKANGTDGT